MVRKRSARQTVLIATLVIASTADGVQAAYVAATGSSAATASGVAYILLADNRLAAVSFPNGTVVAVRRLGRSPPAGAPGEWWRSADGHYLALSKDERRLLAIVPGLVPGRPDGVDRLVVFDTTTLRVRAVHTLPGGLAYHSLAVGSRTGRLYLFGNRGRHGHFGSFPADAIVTVLSPGGAKRLATWTARPARGHNWYAYRGLVTDDERTLFISYHGFDTTGIDRFSISRRGIRRCEPPLGAQDGCIPAHGNIEMYGAHLLAAEGEGPIHEIGTNGRVQRDLDTLLEGNHLLEFAVDSRTGTLYAAGSCIYSGGFSRVDIGTGLARVLVPEGPNGVCGERIAVALDSLVILAVDSGVIPRPGVRGRLLFLDTRSGRVRRSVAIPAEPVDVVVRRPA